MCIRDSLNGTLNLSLINGFVPTVGTTFEILNAGSLSGTFSTVNGTHINGSEHLVVTCDTTDCDVTVASGASAPAQANPFARRPYAAIFGGNFEQNIWSSSRLSAVRVRDMATFKTSVLPIHNFANVRANSGSVTTFGTLAPMKLTSDLLGRNALSLNVNSAFRPMPKFTDGMTPRNFFRSGLNDAVRRGVSGVVAGLPRNARVSGRNRVEYGVNLLSILGMSRWHNRGAHLGSQGTGFGYLVVQNSY